jgi:hypothetical protein
MYKWLLIVLSFLSIDVCAELKDPTKPIYINNNSSASTGNRYKAFSIGKLQLIYSSGNKKYVLIDDVRYTEGESVNGYKITKINENDVVVSENGQQKTFSIFSFKGR